MNTYKAFYRNQQADIEANSSYEAQQLACTVFGVNPKHGYKIGIVLGKVNGTAVLINTSLL